MRLGMTLVLALLSSACLGLRRAEPVPAHGGLMLDGVPRIVFGTERCGPGALASVLAFYGDQESPESLDATLPKTREGGVLSLDLMLAARARGYRVRLVEGTEQSLFAAVREGIPPVLLLRVADLPGRRRDTYHYVVVDGIEERTRRVRLLLGDGEARWISMARLERPWRGTGYALLLVSRRPPPADALEQAVALERAGRLPEAAAAYRALADDAPSSVLWTNLGNVETTRGRLDEADGAYAQALALTPDEPEVLASLAWLRFRQGRAVEAETLAERAARSPGPVQGLALDTVARARLALGRCPEAVQAFRESLDALAPGSAARPAAEEGLAAAMACASSP
jgi:tetratricopeptide (TPR) repeat protein